MPKRPLPPDPGSFYDAPGSPDGYVFLTPGHERLTYWSCGHARRITHKRSPFLPCPPCAAERKRSRKYLAGHVALFVLQLVLIALFARGLR